MAESSPTSNPAARLVHLIERCDSIASQHGDLALSDVWSRTLEAESDRSLFLRRYGLVIGLPSQIRTEVSRLDGEDPALLLEYMGSVEGGFELPFTHPWSKFRGRVNEHVTHTLRIASHALNRQRAEPVVAQSDLDNLEARTRQLYDEVAAAEIDEDLRAFLLRLAERMMDAVVEVRFIGAASLRDSAEQVIGAVVLHRHIVGEPDAAKDKGFLKRVADTAGYIALIANAASAPFNIAIAAQQALPAGEKPEPLVITVEMDDIQIGDTIVVPPDDEDDPESAGE